MNVLGVEVKALSSAAGMAPAALVTVRTPGREQSFLVAQTADGGWYAWSAVDRGQVCATAADAIESFAFRAWERNAGYLGQAEWIHRICAPELQDRAIEVGELVLRSIHQLEAAAEYGRLASRN